MIDERVFKDAWALLCERFNKVPSDMLTASYYSVLSPRMTTEQFRSAALGVFTSNEFFPKPADFFPQRDTTAESLEQWEVVNEVMRGFLSTTSSRLTDETRRVIRLLGGESKLRSTQIDEIQFVRRDFMALYGDAVAVAQREETQQLRGGPEARKIAASVAVKVLP